MSAPGFVDITGDVLPDLVSGNADGALLAAWRTVRPASASTTVTVAAEGERHRQHAR